MNTLNTLPVLLLAMAASAAGWAVFAGAVAVIEAMEPARTGRWLSAAGWIAALVVGLSMALQPRDYGWEMVVLAASLAIVVWRNIHRLREQAARPSPFRRMAPLLAFGVLAGSALRRPPSGGSDDRDPAQ